MTNLRLAFATIFSLCVVLVSSAGANQWTLDRSKSSLGFLVVTTQAEINAQFEAFDARINLDPADLAAASVTLEIDVSSARSGNAQSDGAIVSPAWMAAAEFPKATFASTTIRNTGGNAYEMDGLLTLHGVEKPLTIPFTLDITDGEAKARGEVDVIRTDFGIGQGQFETGDQIKLAVRVRFNFTATR